MEAQEFKVKPLFDRLIVKQEQGKDISGGGIIIPESAKNKPNRGVVVAVGGGTKEEPMEIKVGDTVIIGSFSGQNIEVDGEMYIMLRQSDVLAIL